MYFSTTVALVVLPFLVGAVPAQNSSRDVLSIPLSKRSTPSNADGLVDVENLQASIHHAINKYEQGFNAFENNTGEPHPLASNLAHSNKRRDATGATVCLTNYRHNTMWYGNISVGTPAAPYTVNFDTGSAALFLPGPSCPNCGGLHIYNPTQSSTSKDLGTKSRAEYGKGEVLGELYTDNVVAGGLKATGQTLLATSSITDDFKFNSTTFGADGVMGMGFREISPFNAAPFFETLVDQKQLKEPVFGFYLAESGSELIIGGRNSSRYSGNLTYVNLTQRGYWQTKFDAVSVNGNGISVSTQAAIIDTGTTQVLGDQQSISNIYANIPGAAPLQGSTSLWTIPCNTNVVVSIKFGGTTFNIPPKAYNLGLATNSACLGGFGVMPTTGFWVIGDVFLENVYTEFDYGQGRVGFAQLASA